jgi:hypothetical protein
MKKSNNAAKRDLSKKIVSQPAKVTIRQLPTGVRGLDEILGGGNHSKDIREYVITDKGVVVIRPRSTDYDGLTTGIPQRTGPRQAQEEEAAPEPKARK